MSSKRPIRTAGFSSRELPARLKTPGFSRATSCSRPMASGSPRSSSYAPRWRSRAATWPCSSSGVIPGSSCPYRCDDRAVAQLALRRLAAFGPAEERPGLRVESRLQAAEVVYDGGDIRGLQGSGHAIHDRVLAIARLVFLDGALDVAGVLPGK